MIAKSPADEIEFGKGGSEMERGDVDGRPVAPIFAFWDSKSVG